MCRCPNQGPKNKRKALRVLDLGIHLLKSSGRACCPYAWQLSDSGRRSGAVPSRIFRWFSVRAGVRNGPGESEG